MSNDDIDYLQARAEQELEAAQQARHPSAVRAHFMIASQYLEIVHGSPDAPAKPRAPWQ
jgi:hypothetical protein